MVLPSKSDLKKTKQKEAGANMGNRQTRQSKSKRTDTGKWRRRKGKKDTAKKGKQKESTLKQKSQLRYQRD